MFVRQGFSIAESAVRARLLYHSQVGYYALRTSESMSTRLSNLPYYLKALTGTEGTAAELAAFTDIIDNLPS